MDYDVNGIRHWGRPKKYVGPP